MEAPTVAPTTAPNDSVSPEQEAGPELDGRARDRVEIIGGQRQAGIQNGGRGRGCARERDRPADNQDRALWNTSMTSPGGSPSLAVAMIVPLPLGFRVPLAKVFVTVLLSTTVQMKSRCVSTPHSTRISRVAGVIVGDFTRRDLEVDIDVSLIAVIVKMPFEVSAILN